VPLAGGYARERQSWILSNKTAALSGSVVRGQTPTQQKFDDLNAKEYARLAALAKVGTASQNQVLYIRKAHRIAHMMIDVNANGLLCNAITQQPLDWLMPAFDAAQYDHSYFVALHPYAMDRYGNLFQSEEFKGAALAFQGRAVGQSGLERFNHSSFNAGREVICAGFIGIQQGVLVWIDHNSGHYKPTRDNLKEAIDLLSADGVDLSHARVGAFNHAGGSVVSIDVFSAQAFVTNRTGTPDICSF